MLLELGSHTNFQLNYKEEVYTLDYLYYGNTDICCQVKVLVGKDADVKDTMGLGLELLVVVLGLELVVGLGTHKYHFGLYKLFQVDKVHNKQEP